MANTERKQATGWKSLILPMLFVIPAFAVLIGLGIWQLERLQWKEALLARIDSRIHATAQPLPPAANWPAMQPDEYDYLHVTVTGTYDHAHETALFRAASGTGEAGGKPGYQILTPLLLADGSAIIVNRGFVPLDYKDPSTRMARQIKGDVTIHGLLRAPEDRNAFTPPDDPVKNVWFTRDPVAIARQIGLARVAPFSIDQDAIAVPASARAEGMLMGGATVLSVPNNHLSYAVTWFGLAATLLGVFYVFASRRLRAQPINQEKMS